MTTPSNTPQNGSGNQSQKPTVDNSKIEANINRLSNSVETVTTIMNKLLDRLIHLETTVSSGGNRSANDKIAKDIEEIKTIINELDKRVLLVTTLNTTLSDNVKALKDTIDSKYVTKLEFEPIKKIVYSMSGLTLTGIFGAILSLVIHPK